MPTGRPTNYAERLTFVHRLHLQESDDMTTENLQAENEQLRAQLHRERIDAAVEGDVRSQLVLPAARETFRRMFKLDADPANYSRVSVSDWQAFARTQPRPMNQGAATRGSDAGGADTGPDQTLLRMSKELLKEEEERHLRLTGQRMTLPDAAMLVFRRVSATDPDLAKAYLTMNGEM